MTIMSLAMATAIALLNAMNIEKQEMVRVLHDEQEFVGKFINYILKRNIKIEADLVDQLFNSSEKRLVRALLILALTEKKAPEKLVANISQEILAEFGRDHPKPREFLHEQIQKAGIYSLQQRAARAASAQFTAERCFARLAIRKSQPEFSPLVASV